jgi:hypothetical protein
MPNKASEKKSSRRIRTVVEEVAPATPSSTPTPEPRPTDDQPVPESTATSETVPVEEKAKEVLSELETVQSNDRKGKRRFSLKLLFVLTVLIALIVGFVAGGFYVYTTGMSALNDEGKTQNNEKSSPVASATATASPTASPEPVDVSEYSVSILNGSGIVGEATRVKEILEEAGFTVGTTGNASRFNYTDTLIQGKEGVPEAAMEQLEEALSETYSVEVGEALPESSTSDIVVTVGSTKS